MPESLDLCSVVCAFSSVFGVGALHYHLDLHAAAGQMPRDGIAQRKAAYLDGGGGPSNAAFGYVMNAG